MNPYISKQLTVRRHASLKTKHHVHNRVRQMLQLREEDTDPWHSARLRSAIPAPQSARDEARRRFDHDHGVQCGGHGRYF